jgi:hypothetical protein
MWRIKNESRLTGLKERGRDEGSVILGLLLSSGESHEFTLNQKRQVRTWAYGKALHYLDNRK